LTFNSKYKQKEIQDLPWDFIQNKIFLSSIGCDPGMTVWDSDSDEIIKITDPSFSNIYEMDIDCDAKLIAAGDKNGLIHIHELNNHEDNQFPLKTTLIQGAPVLSVCWVENGQVAASDVAGRCFLWNVNDNQAFLPFQNAKNIICSMFYTDDILTGLSIKGELLLWDINQRNIVFNIETPPLPSMSTLVKMIYWPGNNALAFAGKGGILCLFNLKSRELITVDAHCGDFYALSVWDNNLVSFGLEDQTLKIWDKNSIQVTQSFRTDNNVISATIIPNEKDEFLLINSDGVACKYKIEQEHFKFIKYLGGDKYRICTIPSFDKIMAYKTKNEKNKVNKITKTITQANNPISDHEINYYYKQLSILGYEHVSLGLQVDKAIASGELSKAIELCFSLINTIPQDNPHAYSSLEKYASLLEKSYNLPELAKICKLILKIDPINNHALKIFKRCNLINFEQNSWIIEPDIPIKTVIESAALINNQLTGRFAINSLGKIICEDIRLDTELIINKYIEIQNETDKSFLPTIISEQVCWFSKKHIETYQIISFSNELDQNYQHLQFVVKVVSNNIDTILIPAIIFDCRLPESHNFCGDCRIDILNIYNSIRNNPLSNTYLRKIHKTLNHTLQRIITRKKSMDMATYGFK
jgi:hypothetical protein